MDGVRDLFADHLQVAEFIEFIEFMDASSWTPIVPTHREFIEFMDTHRRVHEFMDTHRAEIQHERADPERWLAVRASELCEAPVADHATLFEPAAPELPRWRVATDPRQRLAGYHADPTVPSARRREAEGVLSLYRHRLAGLDRRAELRVPPPALLGLLMVIPNRL